MRDTRTDFIVAAALVLCSCSPPSAAENAVAEVQENERIATVINLSGNLCADVLWMGPPISAGQYQGEYQVTCNEYRDAKKAPTKKNMVVYLIDPATNKVRLMGRDRE